MKRNILIRGARQLLTLHGPAEPRRGNALGELGLIEDGSVLIVDGLISNVGPTRRIENLKESRTAEVIDAHGRIVLPGFVDSHTRLLGAPGRLDEYRLTRFADAGSAAIGAASATSAAVHYIRNTSGGTLEFNANKYLEASLRHGTTTIEVSAGSGLDASAEMKLLRVLNAMNGRCASVIPSFLVTHAASSEFIGRTAEYVTWLSQEMLPRIREKKSAKFLDILCDPAGFRLEEARLLIDASRRLGIPARLQAEQSVRMGAASLAAQVEAAGITGLNCATADDAALLGRSKTIATLLPGLVHQSVHQGVHARFPPARHLIDSGAAVALASGFRPSACSTLSMQMTISLACTHMNMTSEEAISASTINGAYAVGQGRRCGSLEYGKEADLLILNLSDYREIPYYFGANSVSLVMRKGEIQYRDGTVACGAA